MTGKLKLDLNSQMKHSSDFKVRIKIEILVFFNFVLIFLLFIKYGD